jgi:hypothetical protein
MGQLREQVAEIGVDVEGECSELLRARQCDRRNAADHAEIEVLPVLGERG